MQLVGQASVVFVIGLSIRCMQMHIRNNFLVLYVISIEFTSLVDYFDSDTTVVYKVRFLCRGTVFGR